LKAAKGTSFKSVVKQDQDSCKNTVERTGIFINQS